jgi:histidinol-phosphatase (PHP family)
MPDEFADNWRMSRAELPDYLREVEEVRDAFAGELTVRIGLEADFRPGCEAYLEEMIASYPWDYVIGSVHYVGDWSFDNPDEVEHWESCSIEDIYCSYFDLVAQSAATGLFDIIGHPDLVKKFGHRPPAGSRKVTDAMNAMLRAVKRAGCVLEISSAGLRKPVGEIYPQEDIIALAAGMDIPFTFGSDAHAPKDVGHAMDDCLALLEVHGIRRVCAFDRRRRSMLPVRLSQNA